MSRKDKDMKRHVRRYLIDVTKLETNNLFTFTKCIRETIVRRYSTIFFQRFGYRKPPVVLDLNNFLHTVFCTVPSVDKMLKKIFAIKILKGPVNVFKVQRYT
jgi:hypothetical protein